MDKYYQSVVDNYGAEEIWDAGYLDVGNYQEPHDDVHYTTTPIHKIRQNLQYETGRNAVLLSTGSYAPVHAGHIEIMEKAKRELERRGWNVVGGYLSPSHDAYVGIKNDGSAAMHVGERVRRCGGITADSDWLMVDPWEGRFIRRDVNFTTVYDRLSAYLAKNLPEPVTVWYVFGGDNAGFTKAFASHGHCVCVNRPGAEHTYLQARSDISLVGNPRVLFVDDPTSTVSSTQIRNNHVETLYANEPERMTLFVRGDLGRDEAQFTPKLVWLLREILPFKVVMIGSDQQLDLSFPRPLISLDTLYEGDETLQISRLFEVADQQVAPTTWVNRPGSPSLAAQIRAIGPGEYDFVDDDICTGGTIRFARSILPDTFTVKHAHSLLHAVWGNVPAGYDVVDTRDFQLGAKDGGLVVRDLDGTIRRVPYLLPWVSLTNRASVPPELELELTKKIFELNFELGFGGPQDIAVYGYLTDPN